jgi:hypothetical protein
VGKPTRKPRPTRVQVVSNDAVRSDATVDSGTADEAAVAQTRADADSASAASPSQTQTAQSDGMIVVHDVPNNAVSLTTSDGTQFYAPPDADFQKGWSGERERFGCRPFRRRNVWHLRFSTKGWILLSSL